MSRKVDLNLTNEDMIQIAESIGDWDKLWEAIGYLSAWNRAGVEWVICTQVNGSAGLVTIVMDYGEFGDVLAIVTDLDSREWIAEDGFHQPNLPECLIVDVLPPVIVGDFEAHWRRVAKVDAAWKELEWPEVHDLCSPAPAELVAWCVGWWAGRRDKLPKGETP